MGNTDSRNLDHPDSDQSHPPTSNSTASNTFHIFHFNDVYNVDESPSAKPCGGAARFATALDQLREKFHDNNMVLFSGDALSPSPLSVTTEGAHMIDVINRFDIECAVIGNHDFDFGVDNLLQRIADSNFPWLNGNCFDAATQRLFCDLPPTFVIERSGIRFGILGLVEPEWVDTLSTVSSEDVHVRDFCLEGRRLANELRRNDKCDIIIALTHMRWINDRRLVAQVPEIDLTLGGHDHDYGMETITSENSQKRWLIKSGTDFRQLGHVKLTIDGKKRLKDVHYQLVNIDKSFEPKPEIASIVDTAMQEINQKLDKVIGQVAVDLEGRFCKVRAEETNLGNMLADIALASVNADCALFNSGCMRIDAVIPAGDFTLRSLGLILPILDSTVVVEVTGADILKILENGVSQVPKFEGRFPQVSGIKFAYRADRKPGSRVDKESVRVAKEPIDLDKIYRLATTAYLSTGRDGYKVLANKRQLINEETGIPLHTAVVNYFRVIQALSGFMNKQRQSNHRMRLIKVAKQQELIRNALAHQMKSSLASALMGESGGGGDPLIPTSSSTIGPDASRRACSAWADSIERSSSEKIKKALLNSLGSILKEPKTEAQAGWNEVKSLMVEKEMKKLRVAPKVDGRIVRLDNVESAGDAKQATKV